MYHGIFRPFEPQPFLLTEVSLPAAFKFLLYVSLLACSVRGDRRTHIIVPSSNHVQHMLITFSHFTMFHWHIHIEDLCLNLGLVLLPGQYLCSPTGDAHDDASLKPVPGNAEECSVNRAHHGQRQFKTRTKPGEIRYYPYHPLLTLHKKNHGEVGWGRYGWSRIFHNMKLWVSNWSSETILLGIFVCKFS